MKQSIDIQNKELELKIFKKALDLLSTLDRVLTICDALNLSESHYEKKHYPRTDMERFYPFMLKYKPAITHGVFWFPFTPQDKEKRIEILKAIIKELEHNLAYLKNEKNIL